MSSTYSPSLRIQLIDTGTEFEAWGQPTDNNLGTIIEQAIVGSNTISITNLTSYTLTTANAEVDEARNAVLVFNGALTANCNVIAPSVKKVYVVSNQTTGGKFVNIKTASGNAVNVINGTNQLVYCDGTDFKTAVNVNTIIGNLAVSGNSTVGGNVTITGNITASNVLASSNGNITTNSNSSIVQLSNNTGAFVLPTGNTAQRPSTVKLGMQRWNNELGWMELWNGIIWYPLTGTYGVQYVVVAGGGGGGQCSSFGYRGAGGGGAGGALVGGTTVQSGTAYTITIGAGGAAITSGSNTTALGFVAVKGGYGGGQDSSGVGASGGCGGGGEATTASSGGSGTSGQGYAGGSGAGSGGSGGGGGGAGAVGAASTSSQGGNGGSGVSSSISGTLTYYAGGGGGGTYNGTGGSNRGNPGSGGSGGGGTGGTPGTENTAGDGAVKATSGTANTGGGGGGDTALVYNGGATQTSLGAGAGGSGIAIISYASATQTATGGTVTSYTSGGTTYWVHTFTTSGTFTA